MNNRLGPGKMDFLRRVRRALKARARRFLAGPAVVPSSTDHLSADPDYDAWLQQHRATPDYLNECKRREQLLGWRPLISVIVPVFNAEPRYLELALDSVRDQIYQHWELCIADDCSTNDRTVSFLRQYAKKHDRVKLTRLKKHGHVAGATNAAIDMADGQFLAFLDHDDELTPNALLEVVQVLQDDPDADLIYSDHDILGEDGLFYGPSFKPDWSPDLLLAYMYLGHLKVYRADLLKSLGGLRAGFEGAADYDLALRFVELTDRVRHIPQILYHWRAVASSMAHSSETKPYSFLSGERAVQQALERRHISAAAVHPQFAQASRVGIYKLDFHDAVSEPVTIIIPTRDKCELLKACLESIESRTTYRPYEILVVDNNSRDSETLDYLNSISHRVVRFNTPAGFNFAEITNFAVSHVSSEYFLLLNNDTEVISPDWLGEMMGYARLPEVGAVGAKLIYGDGRIQHAGVIMGVHGLTGHACQPLPNDQAPIEYAMVARNYLAVTAACMLTRKSVFTEVGGFNAADLGVGWNDVDYCLRLHERGYRIVMNPHALLYHYESQSRGDDKNDHEIDYMKTNWRHYIAADPYFNVNFSRANSEFRVKSDPDEARNFYYR